MTNFSVIFAYDWSKWLLFLLIPAVLFTFLPYFRLNKKYRRTRNRIISMILHLIIMVMCICVLSGIVFLYEVPNKESELLLLVDASFSDQEAEDAKNEFIQSIIDESSSKYKIGIVTFGFDQVYAAPLTNDADRVFDEYIAAPYPDDSATDIASALRYARGLFAHPQTGKIVLISDGAETDGDALSVISLLGADGIKVDTAYFPVEHEESEVLVLGVTPPDYNIIAGDPFTLTVTLQSSYEGEAFLTLFDNGTASEETVSVQLAAGVQTVDVTHVFPNPGMHKLFVELKSDDDVLTQNNSYYSYIELQVYDRILVIERTPSESDMLQGILMEHLGVPNLKIDAIVSSDAANMPTTVEELREYDEVVLMNIANADLPIGFDEILFSYVHEFGGGLFTVGGNKDEVDEKGQFVANTYNRQDMYGSLYQQMLPVEAINYTPPIGLIIIIDRSGSMADTGSGVNESKLDLAKRGAIACLNALSDRDYCGIMTLEDYYEENLQITPCSQPDLIREAVDKIEIGGGTVFSGAIAQAGLALGALKGVERKHVILVTDGAPADTIDQYVSKATENYENSNITLSVVSISINASDVENMQALAEAGHGRFYRADDFRDIPKWMREDLNVPEIKEVNYEPFTPRIGEHTSIVNGINEADLPQLSGFYGTKAKKEGVSVPLMGEYVPIYAQWKFGKGMVGSFMCDLEGIWSKDLMESETGGKLLGNIVNALFPTENIRTQDIDVTLFEQNYLTQMSLTYREAVDEGGWVEVIIQPPDEAPLEPMYPDSAEGFSRLSFVVTTPGIHTITVRKMDAEGVVVSECTVYKAFSYSKEYNIFTSEEECIRLLSELAETGGGNAVTEAWEVFEGFANTLKRSFDPAIPFTIAAIILFLLDIAVRKFKFKWPHEIIRDRKAKREMLGRH